MGKRKHKLKNERLYQSLVGASSRSEEGDTHPADKRPRGAAHEDSPVTDEALAASKYLSRILAAGPRGSREMPLMKKFRFQLLHQWLIEHFEPCRVADIGGGKGLLSYLLQKSGWESVVIDPVYQPLPSKYKDLGLDKQIRIDPSEQVAHITKEFEPEMAKDFDLLIAVHAHGCNVTLIDAAARYGRRLILMPCCIINEPLYPPVGTHWLQCLADYAARKGLTIEPFRLNFKGQNIGFFLRPQDPPPNNGGTSDRQTLPSHEVVHVDAVAEVLP